MIQRAPAISLVASIVMAFITLIIHLAGGIFAVLLIWLPIHSMVLALRFLETDEPIISAGVNGLVLTSKITSKDIIGWNDVKQLSMIGFGGSRIPFFNFQYLIIRTTKGSYFDGTSRLFYSSFLFGNYLLPTRLLAGGPSGAAQLVRIVEKLRTDDRHRRAHANGHGSTALPDMDEMGWHMLRNLKLPYDPMSTSLDQVEQLAFADLLLSEAGVHRDLLPKEIESELRNHPVMQQLEHRAKKLRADLRSEKATGKRPLLNGKPLN